MKNTNAVNTNTYPAGNWDERLAWIRLIRTDSIGPVSFFSLIRRFGTAQQALQNLPEIAKRNNSKKDFSLATLESAEKEYEQTRKLGGDFLLEYEDAYPSQLKAIHDPPPVISCIGNKDFLHAPSLAIVGARNASLHGRNFAKDLAQSLGQAGYIIVSGLARGIDTAAHNGSLQTGTIAVIAGGLDTHYPQENKELDTQIRKEGLIIAESPYGTQPTARHFPRRNRIISGLCSGVVVAEANLKSGSLITAQMALEQGRNVYAIPGHPLDPRAQGPNKLIQEGAMLIQKADDIIQNENLFSNKCIPFKNPEQTAKNNQENQDFLKEDDLQKAHKLLLENLSHTPIMVDALARSCQLTIPVVQTILVELELSGRLLRWPGNRVSLVE